MGQHCYLTCGSLWNKVLQDEPSNNFRERALCIMNSFNQNCFPFTQNLFCNIFGIARWKVCHDHGAVSLLLLMPIRYSWMGQKMSDNWELITKKWSKPVVQIWRFSFKINMWPRKVHIMVWGPIQSSGKIYRNFFSAIKINYSSSKMHLMIAGKRETMSEQIMLFVLLSKSFYMPPLL